MMFAYIASEKRHYHLRADRDEAVRRTRQDLKAGKTRLATDDQVALDN